MGGDVGTIIDGKAIAARVRVEVAEVAANLTAGGRRPGLATVLIGDDPASHVYVRNKQRACEEVGIRSFGHRLGRDASIDSVLSVIAELAADQRVHGILVQLPLPATLDTNAVIDAIPPEKDVDGLHVVNQGRLFGGQPGLRPCTPLGVMRLLDEVGIPLVGSRAVVVGRSALVGKPVAMLLLERHATVTLCHSRTRDLAAEIGRADVVVAAVGQPAVIRGEWIREGSVVIDVGINRREDGRLAGDVEFERAVSRAAFITPVPGGVGPMTVAMLLANTVRAAAASGGGS